MKKIFFGLLIWSMLMPTWKAQAASYQSDWQGQSEYKTMVQGQEEEVWVEFKNTGTAMWQKSGNNAIHLGTANPLDKKSQFYEPNTWINENRIEMLQDQVAPGETAKFIFKIKAPFINGLYKEYFRPVVENLTWLNDQGVYWEWRVIGSQGYEDLCMSKDAKTQNSVGACLMPESWMFDAKWVGQSDYVIVSPGEEKDLWVEFENAGTATWYQNGDYAIHLGTANPLDRSCVFASSAWLTANRLVMQQATVKPGERGKFVIKVKAPEQIGVYHEYFRPVVENVSWLKDEGVFWTLEVKEKSPDQPDDTTFDLRNYTATMLEKSGEPIFSDEDDSPVQLQVKYKNTGTATWKRTGERAVELGTSQPYDRNSGFVTSDWLSTNRIAMDQDQVAPGETASFTFNVQPSQTVDYGTHKEHFMLVVAGNNWLTYSEIFWDMSKVKSKSMEITSDGSFRLIEGVTGKKLADLLAGEKVKVAYVAGKYLVKTGSQSWTLDNYVRGEAVGSSIMQITSYDDKKAWDSSVNDNLFRDTIEIRYSPTNKKLWAINELPFEDYLAGVAETSDSSPYEYMKALMIAERSYSLYHLSRGGRHPQDFSDVFNSVNGNGDDQVYRGYSFEKRNPEVAKAVKETKGMVVKYNNKVAVTPYFSHSDGHTRSFEEVWGSKDYPYCKSVLDPYNEGMELFGHGVGMSALGAFRFAEKENKTYDWILKYYYTGIEIGTEDTSSKRIRVGIYSLDI